MAITVVAGHGNGLTANSTFTITGPASYNVTAGDLGIVICNTQIAGGPWAQTAGPAWTGLGAGGALQDDANSGGSPDHTLLAWRTFQSNNETLPTFTWTATGRTTWTLIVVRGDGGNVLSVDTVAGPSFDTTSGTSHTAPAATTATATEGSVLGYSFKASAQGTTAITWTPASGWSLITAGGGTPQGSLSGSASTASMFSEADFQAPVSGTVTPGAGTANVATFATMYQVLVAEVPVAAPARRQSASRWIRRPGPPQQGPVTGQALSVTAGVAVLSVIAPDQPVAITANAGVAAVTAAAPGAAASVAANAGAAAVSVVSLPAIAAPTAAAGAAQVQAAAPAATAAIGALPGVAIINAADPGATVQTSSGVTANAGVAAVTAAAPGAAAAVSPAAAAALVLAAAPAASLQASAAAQAARVLAVALDIPSAFAVARSAPAVTAPRTSSPSVTDPRDGTATVTATATSSPTVTDPRDGTKSVTGATSVPSVS